MSYNVYDSTFPLCPAVLNNDAALRQRPDFGFIYRLQTKKAFKCFQSKLLDLYRDEYDLPYGWKICFCKGSIDEWCASFVVPLIATDGQVRLWPAWAPDEFWLENFQYIADYSPVFKRMLWDDILFIDSNTTRLLDEAVIRKLSERATKYKGKEDFVFITFMFFYYSCIAEENKKNHILGKSVKINAAHQLLLRNWSVEDAAEWCVGRAWSDIARDCVLHDVAIPVEKRSDMKDYVSVKKPWPALRLPRHIKTYLEEWYQMAVHEHPIDDDTKEPLSDIQITKYVNEYLKSLEEKKYDST